MTKLENDQTVRLHWKTIKLEEPNWKMTKLEDDQTGIEQNWKTTKLEYNQTGRQSNWKMTKMENELNLNWLRHWPG